MQIRNVTEGMQIVGIKRVPSKDGRRTYTTYYGVIAWSDYEQDREDYALEGVPVETVQTTETFDIKVGDIVVFYYGRAIGDYQPVKAFDLIEAAPVSKDMK